MAGFTNFSESGKSLTAGSQRSIRSSKDPAELHFRIPELRRVNPPTCISYTIVRDHGRWRGVALPVVYADVYDPLFIAVPVLCLS
jgi:hypothetical protein